MALEYKFTQETATISINGTTSDVIYIYGNNSMNPFIYKYCADNKKAWVYRLFGLSALWLIVKQGWWF